MKLLLDENLSRRIVPGLQDKYPGSSQIALLGMEQFDDRNVWEYAKQYDFVIVTRDDDFRELLQLYGFPPKIILLTMGNCSNQRVLDALNKTKAIIDQLADPDVGIVEVY